MLDAFLIILISLATAFLSELASWVLVYRTESYHKAKKSVDLLTAKVDKKKGEGKDAAAGAAGAKDNSSGAKKGAALESQLKMAERDLSMVKMKGTMVVGLSMLLVFSLLSSLFDGAAVAKLPFEPFGLLRSLSHRNLTGSDFTECSFSFIYVLCSISLRAYVVKALGWTPQTKGPSMFQTPAQR